MPIGPTGARLTGREPANADVKHICPICGGETARLQGALIVIETCWACQGTGFIADSDWGTFERLLRHRESQGLPT